MNRRHVCTQRQKEVHEEDLLNLQEGDNGLELVVAVSEFVKFLLMKQLLKITTIVEGVW